MESLKELSSRLTPINKTDFGKDYGNLLTLLNEEVDLWEILTLSQFYEPMLRCCTFQDFQLAPTLEEFEHILGVSVKDKVAFMGLEELLDHETISNALHMNKMDQTFNLEPKGNTRGFSIKFLIEISSAFANAKNWDAFKVVLALLIYGIIIFHNIDDFIDMLAICIFLAKNPIPIFLVDVYYLSQL